MKKNMLGGLAFLIGLILAVVIAVIGSGGKEAWVFWVLAILGFIVGLLNVTDKETVPFLVAAIAFLISFQALSSVVTKLAFGWAAVGVFFELMGVFVAPAAGVVAIIALLKLSKD